MQFSLPYKLSTCCALFAAALPFLHAQDQEGEAIDLSSMPGITGALVQGEAHENLGNIENFIESRFSMVAMADPDRIYDPFGLVKDGDIEPPKVEVITPPVKNNDGDPKTPVAAVSPLKTTVDQLIITGFNSGGGSILLGVNEISIGQLIPGNEDIFLADVKPTKITFKSKASGEEYSRPVGFNPSGVHSRNEFLDGIEGVQPR